MIHPHFYQSYDDVVKRLGNEHVIIQNALYQLMNSVSENIFQGAPEYIKDYYSRRNTTSTTVEYTGIIPTESDTGEIWYFCWILLPPICTIHTAKLFIHSRKKTWNIHIFRIIWTLFFFPFLEIVLPHFHQKVNECLDSFPIRCKLV